MFYKKKKKKKESASNQSADNFNAGDSVPGGILITTS